MATRNGFTRNSRRGYQPKQQAERHRGDDRQEVAQGEVGPARPQMLGQLAGGPHPQPRPRRWRSERSRRAGRWGPDARSLPTTTRKATMPRPPSRGLLMAGRESPGRAWPSSGGASGRARAHGAGESRRSLFAPRPGPGASPRASGVASTREARGGGRRLAPTLAEDIMTTSVRRVRGRGLQARPDGVILRWSSVLTRGRGCRSSAT